MKNGRFLTKLSILTVLLMLSGSAFAQRGQRAKGIREGRARMGMNQERPRYMAVLDLSDDQKEKMQNLRAGHQKEMTYHHNLINEKNAHLRTLLSSPERDKTAINNTIDEISSLKGELMKKQIANKEEIKSILSTEQIKKLEYLSSRNAQRPGRMHQRGEHRMHSKRGGF